MKNFLFISFLTGFEANAQYEVLSFGDVKRTPLTEIRYTDVTGSPYLHDFWVKGKVTLKNGKKYQIDSLKYNVVDEKLIFKSEPGTLMNFAEPVKAFELYTNGANPLRFVNGLPAANGFSSEAYFQIVAEGKISLFKKIKKEITESKQYGSAVNNKSINTTSGYYCYKDGTFVKISLNKKTITELFGINEEQLNNYLKENKIDFKKDDDLYKLFTYLNL